jgi:hypothetical protein
MKVSNLHRCQLDQLPGVTALWSPCTNGIQIGDDLRKVLRLTKSRGPVKTTHKPW